MQKLTTRIEEHIYSLSPDELTELFISNYAELNEFELGLPLPERICRYINKGYDDYVHSLKEECKMNIAWMTELDKRGELHPKIKYKASNACSIYKAAKFFKDDEVVSFLNKMGIGKFYHDHFVSFNLVEETLIEIVKAGFIIRIIDVLIMIDKSIVLKIGNDLHSNFTEMKTVENYDSRKKVPQIEIDIRNMERRWKYNENNPNYIPKGEFEEKMFEVHKEWKAKGMKGSFSQSIIAIVNDRISTLQNDLYEFFNPLLQSHKKKDIRQTFKPFFHIIFNHKLKIRDREDFLSYHLLTENEFKKHKIDDVKKGEEVPYDGNYKKYYNLRIAQLVGI